MMGLLGMLAPVMLLASMIWHNGYLAVLAGLLYLAWWTMLCFTCGRVHERMLAMHAAKEADA